MELNMQHRQPAAIAHVRGEGGLGGTVSFFPHPLGTLVWAQIRGLPDNGSGFFAFHIHQGDNCRGPGFPNTGSHFNPGGKPHPLHAGDLPPLLRCGTQARMQVVTDRFQVRDVIGRTVVIHSRPDDFFSQPAGNSGAKIACGIIRKV